MQKTKNKYLLILLGIGLFFSALFTVFFTINNKITHSSVKADVAAEVPRYSYNFDVNLAYMSNSNFELKDDSQIRYISLNNTGNTANLGELLNSTSLKFIIGLKLYTMDETNTRTFYFYDLLELENVPKYTTGVYGNQIEYEFKGWSGFELRIPMEYFKTITNQHVSVNNINANKLYIDSLCYTGVYYNDVYFEKRSNSNNVGIKNGLGNEKLGSGRYFESDTFVNVPPNKYLVTFDVNGEIKETQFVNEGEYVSKPNIVTPNGANLTWYTHYNSYFQKVFNFESMPVKNDLYLTAVINYKEFSYNFLNGYGESIINGTAKSNKSLTEILNGFSVSSYAEKPGYILKGFSTSDSGEIIKDFREFYLTEDTVFYPIYEAFEYTLTFYAANADYSDLVKKYTIEDTVIPPVINDKWNEEFVGWGHSSSLDSLVDFTNYKVSENDSFLPIWKKKTITFQFEYSENDIVNIDLKSNITFKVPSKDKFGYFFNGWYLEPTFETKIDFGNLLNSNYHVNENTFKDTIFYAKYTSEYFGVIFYDKENNAIEINYKAYTINDTISFPTPPNVDGFHFAGWKILDNFIDMETYKISANSELWGESSSVTGRYLKIYAYYSPSELSLKFMIDNEIVKEQIIDCETQIYKPNDLIKKGYVFLGWTLNTQTNEIVIRPNAQTNLVENYRIFEDTVFYAVFDYIGFETNFYYSYSDYGTFIDAETHFIETKKVKEFITVPSKTPYEKYGYEFYGYFYSTDLDYNFTSDLEIIYNLDPSNNYVITIAFRKKLFNVNFHSYVNEIERVQTIQILYLNNITEGPIMKQFTGQSLSGTWNSVDINFKGWNAEFPLQVTEELNIYGEYEKMYKVNFTYYTMSRYYSEKDKRIYYDALTKRTRSLTAVEGKEINPMELEELLYEDVVFYKNIDGFIFKCWDRELRVYEDCDITAIYEMPKFTINYFDKSNKKVFSDIQDIKLVHVRDIERQPIFKDLILTLLGNLISFNFGQIIDNLDAKNIAVDILNVISNYDYGNQINSVYFIINRLNLDVNVAKGFYQNVGVSVTGKSIKYLTGNAIQNDLVYCVLTDNYYLNGYNYEINVHFDTLIDKPITAIEKFYEKYIKPYLKIIFIGLIIIAIIIAYFILKAVIG